MLKAGDKAPDSFGKDENGKEHFLADYKGKKLLVFFYPKDNTPGCTMEACSLRDAYAELKEKNVGLVGVSADDEVKHKKFIEKYSLPFPLIADTEKSLINDFGVWGPKKFMGRTFDGIIRTSFLINEEGAVEYVIDKVKTKVHSEQVLEYLNK